MWDWTKSAFRVWLAFVVALLIFVTGLLVLVSLAGFLTALCEILLR